MLGPRGVRSLAILLAVAIAATSCIRLAPTPLRWSLPSGHAYLGAVTADVTGDGGADVVVLTDRALLRVESCGTDCLVTAQTLPIDGGLTLFGDDVDNDGVADALIRSADAVTTYFGGAADTIRSEGFDPADTAVHSLDADHTLGWTLDYDGDGFADLLTEVSCCLPQASVRLGDGTGQFVADATFDLFNLTIEAVGDVDGDQDDDILFVVCVGLLGTCGYGVFGAAIGTVETILANFSHATLADLDHDGREEIVSLVDLPFALPFTALHLRGSSGGAWLEPSEHPLPDPMIGAGSGTPVVFDADGDGTSDVFVATTYLEVLSWWMGDGSGDLQGEPGANRFERDLGFPGVLLDHGDVTGNGLDDLLMLDTALDPPGIVVIENDSFLPVP